MIVAPIASKQGHIIPGPIHRHWKSMTAGMLPVFENGWRMIRLSEFPCGA